MVNEQLLNERKKQLHSLRSFAIRYRSKGKSDTMIINAYAYEKGMPVKDVAELFQLLLDAEKLPRVI